MGLKSSNFAARPPADELPLDWHFGTFRDVMQRSQLWVFCRLIVHSVSTTAFVHEAEVFGCWVNEVGLRVCVGLESNVAGHHMAPGETLRLTILPEMVGACLRFLCRCAPR
jgi:hypothetical protein